MTETPSPRPTLDTTRPVVALGVALLATAVVLSTAYSRASGELDGSTFAVGLLATGGLLAFAGAAYLRFGPADLATDLATWPGAFGTAGAGLMVAVAMDVEDSTPYVAGVVVVLLSAAGLALTRRGPFVVTGILGLLVSYLQGIDDVLGSGGDDGVPGVRIALALTVFAVLVTAAGWQLPAARVLGGVVAGAVTLAGFATLVGLLSLEDAFIGIDPGPPTFDDDGSGGTYSDYVGPLPDGHVDDAWTILALALLLVLGWCACAALTGHVAYRVLLVAMAVTITPLALQLLTVTHPTWWGVTLGAAGGVVLVGAGLRALRPRP